jgi:membrane protein CcdC involved in cytochrome C biogenesis
LTPKVNELVHVAVALGSLAGAAVVIGWRLRETRRPVTARSILIPPLGMSTGLAMFVVPATHIPWGWALGAFFTGVLVFSVPLVRTSQLHVEGGAIVLKRSKAFLWILLGLVAVRFGLREYVGRYVTTPQTGAIFFLLALGMVLTWRVMMFRRYRALQAELARR